ncbi:MAG: glutamate--tRNA ligase [Bacteroidaceae bacterium]|nr:glutamate--tRNA ligase [Bacteroidaceae bacterium]
MAENGQDNGRRVRVRFAPSPTGPLHIGGVRTAIYNYLFARRNGGDFVFRIEDTDTNRFVPGAEEYIIQAFDWLGIKFDEGVSFGGNYGPYRQSERRDIYKKYVQILLDSGKAYIAFDTPEQLDAKRAEIPNFQYDATTRMGMTNSLTLSKEEVEKRIAAGEQYVVRFKIEPDINVEVHDLIRGLVVINSSILDDKVLFKSADQLPTYHLANIVDDHLMEITHVIRGEEWLPSAPLHVLLYKAFGWEDTMPNFAHLPLLLKPEGSGKLSKRDGDKLGFPVFPLEWHDPKTGEVSSGYREKDYLPQAVINFLALLGWNPGNDLEIMSLEEMVNLFSLEHCSKAGARFNYQKLVWFNHEYIMNTADETLVQMFMPILQKNGINISMEKAQTVVGMFKNRLNFISELWDMSKFLFIAPEEYDEKSAKKWWKEGAAEYVSQLCDFIESAPTFNGAELEPMVMDWIASKEYPTGKVMNALRVALVGAAVGPHIFQITDFIGKEETLRRARKAILYMQQN